jgi:hypothetical protein
MPSGSKPGERRGGRKRGTPNKKTLLKNGAIKAAAINPNLSPLEFLLNLMRQADLPLELRVTVAQQALPFAHPKPKAHMGVQNRNGQSRSNVNEKIGPRVEVRKVNADNANDADAHIMPLDFLLGVMRDPHSPAELSLRAASIAAPFVHSKGEPNQVNEAPGQMIVIEDPYGFDADIGDTLESIHQDQKRLHALEPRIATLENGHDVEEYVAACEKVKRTTAYRELEKSIAEKQAALKCPPNYKELDSRQDRARLKELATESKARPLTAAEELEQKHLHARLAAYSRTPESADCERLNLLKALDADLLKPEEKEELERLETRYPEVPLDLTRIERHVLLAAEAVRRLVLYRPGEGEAMRRTADNRFRDLRP